MIWEIKTFFPVGYYCHSSGFYAHGSLSLFSWHNFSQVSNWQKSCQLKIEGRIQLILGPRLMRSFLMPKAQNWETPKAPSASSNFSFGFKKKITTWPVKQFCCLNLRQIFFLLGIRWLSQNKFMAIRSWTHESRNF